MELSDTCLPASQQTREFHVIGWVERSGEGCPLVHAPVRVHVASLAWPSRLENDHRGEQKLTGQRPRMSPWSQLESTRLTLPEELAEVPPVPVDLSFLSVRRECTATHFLPCTHSREKNRRQTISSYWTDQNQLKITFLFLPRCESDWESRDPDFWYLVQIVRFLYKI